MTRKQAVLKAIELLETNKKNTEIVRQLKIIYDELPLVKWSRESILDSIQQYINEHNNVFPSQRHFGKTLPSSQTLNRKFKTNGLQEFREVYFPETCDVKSPYSYYSNEDFLRIFKENYNSINGGLYVKYDDYNLYRQAGTPKVSTIISRLNCDSYNDLLIKAEIRKKKGSYSISGNRNTEIKTLEENIRELNKIIN